MSSITALPPELLLKIFGYTSPELLVNNIQNVCTSWRQHVQSMSLWKDYVYAPLDVPIFRSAVNFAESCPMLKHVRVRIKMFIETEGLENFISALIRNCWDLRTFCFAYRKSFPTIPQINALFEAFPNMEAFTVTVDSMTCPEILCRISKCTRLKTLVVDTLCNDCSFTQIVNGCRSLEELYIIWPEVVESEYLYILENMKDRLSVLSFSTYHPGTQLAVDLLSSFTKLQHLELDHDDEFGPVNFLPLANIKTLKSLNFTTTTISYKDAETIFDMLFHYPLPKLERLTVIFYNCEQSIAVLKDICRCYPKLKSLELYNNGGYVGDSFEDIYRMERLESLSYVNSKSITDEDVEHIAQCHLLKQLSLKGCVGLTDKSIAHLANSKSLETLNISRCQFSRQSLQLIAENLRKLTDLNISYLPIGQKDVDELNEKMPSTVVHF